MKKLGGIVCDGCRRFITYGQKYITIKGKKRTLHYCCEACRDEHRIKDYLK